MTEQEKGLRAEIQLALLVKGILVIAGTIGDADAPVKSIKVTGVRKNLIKNIYRFNRDSSGFYPQTEAARGTDFLLLMKAKNLDQEGMIEFESDAGSVALAYRLEDQAKISRSLVDHLRHAADYLDIEELRESLGVAVQYISFDGIQGAKQGYFGCLDIIDGNGIQGWAVNLAKPSDPLKIRVLLRSRIIGTAYTVFSRNDVSASAGVPLPACGFHLKWNRVSLPPELKQLDRDIPCELLVQIEGTNLVLVNLKGKWPSVGDLLGWCNPQPVPMSGSAKKIAVETFLDKDPVENEVAANVKAIAFFLPQFHPIPENDAWWGPGFTEWTNVTQAKPSFPGHEQPHIPGELGFYDLRLPELREAQAKLAREYGIYGFCYYYYWFAGRRILERPLDDMLKSGSPDFPFCICWANESWSKRWDGSEDEVLLKQEHTPETDVAFIRDVIPILKDPRYIQINGAPLLVVYRVNLFPDPKRTAAVWRKICADEGLPNIHLAAVEFTGFNDPYGSGFDSSIEFPPLNISPAETVTNEIEDLDKDFSGGIYDYRQYAIQVMLREPAPYRRYRGIIPGWDNTPRRGKRASLFVDSEPQTYEMWLRAIVEETRNALPAGERFIFINAWNEWAEGAHLEPDIRHGRAYLESTRRGLTGRSDWRILADYARAKGSLSGSELEDWISDIESQLLARDRSLQYLRRLHSMKTPLEFNRVIFSPIPSSILEYNHNVKGGGHGVLDTVNNQALHEHITLDHRRCALFAGWCIAPEAHVGAQSATLFFLEHVNNRKRYFASVIGRAKREDVANTFPEMGESVTLYAGYHFYGELSQLDAGEYRMGVFQRAEQKNIETLFDGVLRVV
ncbi:glycoside hydrolase family 99-like domain-containing protein [Methylomagnum ishizawai]|uniref:glycoside hydrolase family 99-like domain-containing protein n=1 Tax=Methylomagnum ishizawai TaxID=1760988 RepID=UPI001C3264C8|nr:glycoside hydrolase family 99-like domain-containing protein [Methylomagnum ishizawai]BBL75940.1 hypothetical protein MishRS11D_30380 [Methylomagnum ishizawai]